MAVVIPFIGTWDNKALLKAGRDIRQTGALVKRTGAGISSAGKLLTVGLTLPLLLAGGFALKSAADIGAAHRKIRTQTGQTGASLAGLKRDFDRTFAGVPDEAADVAVAIGQIHSRTDAAGAPLQRTAKQILNLTRLTGDELEPTIAAVTRVYGDWSIATKDQAKATDYLFKASQATGIKVTELAETVVQFGAPLRQLGFSFKESAAMLGKWEKEGVNTQTALAGLRFSLKTFAREGLDAREGLRKYTQEIKDAKSPAEATGLAMKVFGLRAGADMAAAIREGRFDLDALIGQIKKSPETINKAAEETLTFSQHMKIFRNQLMLAAQPLGKVIIQLRGELLPVFKQVVAGIGRASEAFSRLPDRAKRAIVIGAMIAATLGPALMLVGQMVTSIGGLMQTFGSALGGVVGLVGKFGGAAAAAGAGAEGAATASGGIVAALGPVGAVIATVVAAIAAIVLLFRAFPATLEPVKKAFSGLSADVGPTMDAIVRYVKLAWQMLAPVVVPILKGLATAIGQILGAVINIIRAVMAVIRGDWKGAWEALKAAAAGILKGLWALVVGIFQGLGFALKAIWAGLKMAAVAAWNALRAAIVAQLRALVGALAAGWGMVKTGAAAAWNGLLMVVAAAIERVKDTIATGIAIAISLLTGNWKKAGQLTLALLSPLTGIVRRVWNSIKTAIARAWPAIKAVVSAGWNAVVSFHRTLPSRLASLARAAWNALRSAIARAWPAVKSAVKSGWESVMKFFRELPSKVVSIGGDIVAGLLRGMQSAWGRVTGWLMGQVNDMIRRVKEKLGVRSPSRVFAWIGSMMMKGFTVGITGSAASVMRTVSTVTSRIIAAAAAAQTAYAEQVAKIKARGAELAGTWGLFDAPQVGMATGSGLLENLKAQVDTLSKFKSDMAALAKRGISKSLLAELRAQGPSAAGQVAALLGLGSSELRRYGELYSQRGLLGRQLATAELGAAIAPGAQHVTIASGAVRLNITVPPGMSKASVQKIVDKAFDRLVREIRRRGRR